jgi:hypothetical protein
MSSGRARASALRTIPYVGAALLLLGGASAAISWTPPPPEPGVDAPYLLPAVSALPMRVDTLYLGGYASGSFQQALQTIAAELPAPERTMIGRHLDKIFLGVLQQNGLGRTGRLRLACERVARSDGSTRAMRVLAAEVAVGGELHTAFFFENGEQPGYFDGLGRSLEERGWARPLAETQVTSNFGMRRMHPILQRELPHTGTDYAAALGTPVHATADGSISEAGERGGYGMMVEIQHPNGYSTRYAHLSAITLPRGAPVQQGDLIGYSGMSGLVTGPHLHYEVRRQGRPIDPEGAVAQASLSADVGYDVRWGQARRTLARLLARAPTLVRGRAAGP